MVNSNAKSQNQSDQVLLVYGMKNAKGIPQLFNKNDSRELFPMVSKIVDDSQTAGSENNAQIFIDNFHSKPKLGTGNKGPGS